MSVNADAWITLAQLKTHLGLSGSSDDARLEAAINDAADAIFRFLNRKAVLSATYTEQYDGNGDDNLVLAMFPVISVTTFHVDTGRTFDSTSLLTEGTDFVTLKDDGIVELVTDLNNAAKGTYTFPRARKCIKIVYVAGWTQATVPDDLVRALLEAASHLFNNRGTTRDVQSHSIGGFSESFAKDTPQALPQQVRMLLEPWKDRQLGPRYVMRS